MTTGRLVHGLAIVAGSFYYAGVTHSLGNDAMAALCAVCGFIPALCIIDAAVRRRG
jgi:hypothetical protein